MSIDLSLRKRFELLANHVGVQPDMLRKQMIQFLCDKYRLSTRAAKSRVDGWWKFSRNPQQRGKHQLKEFFTKTFNEKNKKFDEGYLDMDMEYFLQHIGINYSEATGLPELYSTFKAYRNAAIDDNDVEYLINKYRGYYYLYWSTPI